MKQFKLLLALLVVLLLTAAMPDKRTTIFVIGDSTAANKDTTNGKKERGWAMMLQGCFDANYIVVDNHAVNGRSSKSFINEGRWDKVLEKIKPGDYVIIQFGHNDEKAQPDRHTDPGTTFDANLEKYISETRQRGGIPVLMNCVVRRNFFVKAPEIADDELLRTSTFKDGVKMIEGDTLIDTHGLYKEAPKHVARKTNCHFIDANKITHDLEQGLGREESKKLHMWFLPGTEPSEPKGKQDNTHYNIYGATTVANLLADALCEEIPTLIKYRVKKTVTTVSAFAEKPWSNGRLKVSANQRFLQFENGKPFFWLGETAWLMPERLNRDEVALYLKKCNEAGYNMVQVQVLNGVPSFNAYGTPSHNKQSRLLTDVPYSYWDHLDYIVDVAAQNNIYIGMVSIWGSLVKAGKLSVEQAKTYGRFLANRYKDRPNIIWIMGGDIQGDIKPEVWETLATTIKSIDKNHLMTYHPRGRYTSAHWWNKASWIDFHCFQSGHRRYGQRMGNKDYPIPDNTEEDNWMYVDSTWAYKPIKPVLDDEPIYEGIPQGLHDAYEPLWQACDVRRYAYWSVFAGSCGHTYGHNAIMQFYREGYAPAYHNKKVWTDALHDPGFNQMKYLKQLILSLPYFERVADQSIVLDNGTQYNRLAATRGNDYLLVYNYTNRPMKIDLRKVSGEKKKVWWMNTSTGQLTYLGLYENKIIVFQPHKTSDDIEDGVLIAIDSTKNYLSTLP